MESGTKREGHVPKAFRNDQVSERYFKVVLVLIPSLVVLVS